MIAKEKKQAIIAEYGRTPNDTGSPEVQVVILTARIQELKALKKQTKGSSFQKRSFKDGWSETGLLDYLKKIDIERYRSLIERLGIRK